MRFTSSAAGVKPIGHSAIHVIQDRGDTRFTSSTIALDASQPQSRSHSSQHEETSSRIGRERQSRSRSPGELWEGDNEHDSRDSNRGYRSRSPRCESRRDYSFGFPDQNHTLYSQEGMRHHSTSPRRSHHRQYQSTPPLLQQPLSWEQIVELSPSDYGKEFTLRYYSNPYRLWTFPRGETQPFPTSSEFPFAALKPHIDFRTGKPHHRMRFTDQNTMQLLLGKDGSSLAELNLFFPAVVFRFEEALNIPDPILKKPTATFWLEVKSSSDPRDDGVKWQVDACRRGFEAYHRTDEDGLPCVKDFYYANRRVFHHSQTTKGVYLQGLPRPRNIQELMAQVNLKDYAEMMASQKATKQGQ